MFIPFQIIHCNNQIPKEQNFINRDETLETELQKNPKYQIHRILLKMLPDNPG